MNTQLMPTIIQHQLGRLRARKIKFTINVVGQIRVAAPFGGCSDCPGQALLGMDRLVPLERINERVCSAHDLEKAYGASWTDWQCFVTYPADHPDSHATSLIISASRESLTTRLVMVPQ